MLADSHGLNSALWLMFGLTLVAGIVAMFLKETAPNVVSRRVATPYAA
jgi:hypothetical protein